MSRRRCPSGSLIDDIVAVAAHQTEEIAFLRAALEMVAVDALNSQAITNTKEHQRDLGRIWHLCCEALSMQGGADE